MVRPLSLISRSLLASASYLTSYGSCTLSLTKLKSSFHILSWEFSQISGHHSLWHLLKGFEWRNIAMADTEKCSHQDCVFQNWKKILTLLQWERLNLSCINFGLHLSQNFLSRRPDKSECVTLGMCIRLDFPQNSFLTQIIYLKRTTKFSKSNFSRVCWKYHIYINNVFCKLLIQWGT